MNPIKNEEPILLETKRLIVKRSSLANLDEVSGLFSDAEVMRFIGRGVRSRDMTREALEKMIKHQAKHGFSVGDVYEKQSGNFIGRSGLVYLEMNDQQPDIEVGYTLHKAYWNKGYASELARAFLSWGFQHLPVSKFVAVCYPENEASRRVMEKAGMHYVGSVRVYDVQSAKYEIDRYLFDDKKIKLQAAGLDAHPLIQNMGRFYVYDMSEYMGAREDFKLPADGLYECIDFKKYWERPETYPFLIYYDNELAGFAIVDKNGSEPEVDFNMAQFFILRKFKNKGLGRHAAYQLFDKFRGSWEVMVMPGNEGAYRFWWRTIKAYAHDHFSEYTREVKWLNNSPKNILRFQSRG